MSEDLLAVGQVVAGRYRVERVLGRGGMGTVVAARHLDLDETFALKVMTPQAFGSADAVERFIREARMTAKLRSPHALRVSDCGRLPNGAPYLAMEYLQGRDLEKELDARGPLPAAEAATYVIQACDVLAEAHAMGIVHRDIKPANLFLTRLPNGSPCIKVLDFGIAMHNNPLEGPRMTQTTAVFGTPLYMSPEQMKSARSVDPRADIWSLGVVLYELVTGGVPFDAGSMTELVAKVLTEAPVFPSARRAGVPPELEAVIMRCLERDPQRRHPTVSALAQALSQAVASAGRPAGAAMPAAAQAPAQAFQQVYPGAAAPQAQRVSQPPGASFPAAGTYPPGAAHGAPQAPGTYPPGAMPPGTYPPGAVAAATYPPGAPAHATQPPGAAGARDTRQSLPSNMPTDMALSSAARASAPSSSVPVVVGAVVLAGAALVGLAVFFLRGSGEPSGASPSAEPATHSAPSTSAPEVVPTPTAPPSSSASADPAPSASASASATASAAATSTPTAPARSSGSKKPPPKGTAAPAGTQTKSRGGFL